MNHFNHNQHPNWFRPPSPGFDVNAYGTPFPTYVVNSKHELVWGDKITVSNLDSKQVEVLTNLLTAVSNCVPYASLNVEGLHEKVLTMGVELLNSIVANNKDLILVKTEEKKEVNKYMCGNFGILLFNELKDHIVTIANPTTFADHAKPPSEEAIKKAISHKFEGLEKPRFFIIYYYLPTSTLTVAVYEPGKVQFYTHPRSINELLNFAPMHSLIIDGPEATQSDKIETLIKLTQQLIYCNLLVRAQVYDFAQGGDGNDLYALFTESKQNEEDN